MELRKQQAFINILKAINTSNIEEESKDKAIAGLLQLVDPQSDPVVSTPLDVTGNDAGDFSFDDFDEFTNKTCK